MAYKSTADHDDVTLVDGWGSQRLRRRCTRTSFYSRTVHQRDFVRSLVQLARVCACRTHRTRVYVRPAGVGNKNKRRLFSRSLVKPRDKIYARYK